MFEKFSAPKSQNKEQNSEYSNIRRLIISGLGAVTISTTALYRDSNGDGVLEKAEDYIYKSILEDKTATLSSEERAAYELVAPKLLESVGVVGLVDIIQSEERAHHWQNKEKVPPIVEGFEEMGAISNEDIVAMTSSPRIFPSGWISGKISSISYASPNSGKDGLLGQNLRQPGVFDEITIFNIEPSGDFSGERGKYAMHGLVLKVLRHEVCHSNDWGTTTPQTFTERIDLLSDIINRAESNDPYRGHLVSNKETELVPYHTTYGNETRKERITSYKEYFADVCEAYLSNADELKDTYPEDYKIIDTWIQTTDKNFRQRLISGPFSQETGEILPEWKGLFY